MKYYYFISYVLIVLLFIAAHIGKLLYGGSAIVPMWFNIIVFSILINATIATIIFASSFILDKFKF